MADAAGPHVHVPEDFRRIGFSGDFWIEVEVDPGFTREAPCLLNPGWLLLSRHGKHGVVVRRDENAIVDVATGRLRPKPPYPKPSRVAD